MYDCVVRNKFIWSPSFFLSQPEPRVINNSAKDLNKNNFMLCGTVNVFQHTEDEDIAIFVFLKYKYLQKPDYLQNHISGVFPTSKVELALFRKKKKQHYPRKVPSLWEGGASLMATCAPC